MIIEIHVRMHRHNHGYTFCYKDTIMNNREIQSNSLQIFYPTNWKYFLFCIYEVLDN